MNYLDDLMAVVQGSKHIDENLFTKTGIHSSFILFYKVA
jgi:hypothetical protein